MNHLIDEDLPRFGLNSSRYMTHNTTSQGFVVKNEQYRLDVPFATGRDLSHALSPLNLRQEGRKKRRATLNLQLTPSY